MRDVDFLLLLPQIGIGIASWFQIVFSINRFNGLCRFHMTDLWGLMLFFHASFSRWVAVMSVRTSSFSYQLFVSMLSATLQWESFVIVFNKDFVLPTRQQTFSLVMTLLVTGLWEVNNALFYHSSPK